LGKSNLSRHRKNSKKSPFPSRHKKCKIIHINERTLPGTQREKEERRERE
jgi:hypothetical protein